MAVTKTVLVPFYDDFINAFQDGKGEVWVILRECCKVLGLDVEVQCRRMEAKWEEYMIGRRTCRLVGDVNARIYIVIAARSIGPWLTNIELGPVRPEVQPKLERYRDELKDVLYAHFQGQPINLPEKRPMTAIPLAKVPFHGDTIRAFRAEDGDVKLHVRELCRSLGVDYRTQARKLRASKTYLWSHMTLQLEPDGQERRCVMLSSKSLELWLASMDENRVAPEARAKLILFRKEAQAALHAYFQGQTITRTPQGVLATDPVPALSAVSDATVDRVLSAISTFVIQSNKANEAGAAALAVVRDLLGAHLLATADTATAKQLVETRTQLAAALTRLSAVEVVAELARQTAQDVTVRAGGNLGWTTVVAYYRRKNISLTADNENAIGRVLTARMEAAGTLPRKVGDPRHPRWHVNQYPLRLLNDYYDERAGLPLPTTTGDGT